MPTAGVIRVSGGGLVVEGLEQARDYRHEFLETVRAGTTVLRIRATGTVLRRLRARGSARIVVAIAFAASDGGSDRETATCDGG